MSHGSTIGTDSDGFHWATCECGWKEGPFVGVQDAADAYGDHRAEVATALTLKQAPFMVLDDIGLRQLRAVNVARAERWHDGKPWSGADWATAVAGEMGEACNVVKKLRRSEDGIAPPHDPPRHELLHALGVELADTIIYADLLAQHYGADLAWHVAAKFNEVSDRMGLDQKLPIPAEG